MVGVPALESASRFTDSDTLGQSLVVLLTDRKQEAEIFEHDQVELPIIKWQRYPSKIMLDKSPIHALSLKVGCQWRNVEPDKLDKPWRKVC